MATTEDLVRQWADGIDFSQAHLRQHVHDLVPQLSGLLARNPQGQDREEVLYKLERIEHRQRIIFDLLFAILSKVGTSSQNLSPLTKKLKTSADVLEKALVADSSPTPIEKEF
jgi:hypothetical protein